MLADFPVFVQRANNGGDGVAAEPLVNDVGHPVVDCHLLPALNLNYHVESWRGFALQDGFLSAPVARFLVAEGYRLNAAHQIGQGGIQNQVIQGVAMGGSHQLHAPLGDGSGGGGLGLGAHLVNDDDLGHMVFHRLDHHPVLLGGGGDLHSPRVTDGRMGDIAIPGDLV